MSEPLKKSGQAPEMHGRYDACAFYGFQFGDFSLERVLEYWRLLELEYGLKVYQLL